MTRSHESMWRGYHFMIKGIRKEYLFLSKCMVHERVRGARGVAYPCRPLWCLPRDMNPILFGWFLLTSRSTNPTSSKAILHRFNLKCHKLRIENVSRQNLMTERPRWNGTQSTRIAHQSFIMLICRLPLFWSKVKQLFHLRILGEDNNLKCFCR